jgi:uncharacterized membrane protein YkoI
MPDKIRKTVLVIALVAAFALGGAAVAGAVQGGSSTAAATTTTQEDEDRPAEPRQQSDETALTGDTAAKVRAAALAEFPGATIERLETDGDGNAAYEAHMRKSDGSRVTVYVNREFDVVGSEEGHGRGGHGRGGRSDEAALTGDTAAKVRAAALAEFPGATIERLEADGEGNAAYEAHVVTADGARVTVYVDRQFEVVGTEEGRGRGPGRDDDAESDDDGNQS